MMEAESPNFSQRYFLIDSKLNSSDVAVVTDALNDLHDLLQELQDRSLANSALLRLVNLMSIASSFYIKNKIGLVLAASRRLCREAINKAEIVNSLTAQIHASDRLTRIIYLRLIAELAPLFKTEISAYHHLLKRFAQTDASQQQRVAVYRCLKNIMQGSQELSRIFLNNLPTYLSSQQMPIKLLMRLCCSISIDNKDYTKLVQAMWRSAKYSNSKQIHRCLASVLSKGVICNPRVAELYVREIKGDIKVDVGLRDQLTELAIQYHPYLFEVGQLKEQHEAVKNRHIQQLLQGSELRTLQQKDICTLLDALYEMKQQRKDGTAVKRCLDTYVLNALMAGNELTDSELELMLLSCYYLQRSFDASFAPLFSTRPNIRLLKILTVVRYPLSALAVAQAFLNQEKSFAEYLRFIFYRSIAMVLQESTAERMTHLIQCSESLPQGTPSSLLSSYYTHYLQAVTHEWNSNSIQPLLQSLLELQQQLAVRCPSLRGHLECFMALLEKAVLQSMSSIAHNLDWYRKEALKYLPDHAIANATSVQQILLCGVHYPKAALP